MSEVPVIEVSNLTHRYGRRAIYEDLNFSVGEGRIFGLLGKNGVGKTTLIKLLMGFLRPTSGTCRVLGDDSFDLSPATKARVGLLFEGHLAYDFLTIEQAERFHSQWYPKWRRDRYYDLVDRLRLPYNHRIRDMSEGQRSQVVLGLIMAQDPDLLILDDYTMGLDAGYRRLFLDYLIDYVRAGRKTVFVTSHVVQDLERLVDEVIFLQRGGNVLQTSLDEFMKQFHQFRLPRNGDGLPSSNGAIHNVEAEAGELYSVYSFKPWEAVEEELKRQGLIDTEHQVEEVHMSLEDAFIGFTGKY